MMKLIIGNAISFIFIFVAVYFSEISRFLPFIYRVFVLLLCWYFMLYFTHCLSHYIVGRIVGVEFSHYFFSKSMLSKAKIPVLSRVLSRKVFLTLKIKKRVSNRKMFLMFMAGPVASMFSPLLIATIAYRYDKLLGMFLFMLSAGNILFSGYYSYKFGCIRKAFRVLKGLDWRI